MTPACSPWYLLLLAIPILLLGEWLLRRVPLLARINIPVPVAGGLLFSAACLSINLSGLAAVSFGTKVSAGWWTWLVTPDIEWLARPAKNLNLPLLIAFFTCVGLGAPLRVLLGGGRMLVVLLLATTVLSALQNAAGVAVAVALGAPALLGVACGSLTLVGGHGTALGFASRFEQAGLASAATIGASAATFGLVAGALLSGPLGAWLLRKVSPIAARGASASGAGNEAENKAENKAGNRAANEAGNEAGNEAAAAAAGAVPGTAAMTAPAAAAGAEAAPAAAEVAARPAVAAPAVANFVADVRALFALGRGAALHLLLVAACVKAGAWVSFGLDRISAALPAYMGALLVGFAVRAIHDALGGTWLRGETIARIAAVLLPLFLAVTLAAQNLADLASVAGPMLAILAVNIALTLLFCAAIVWPLLGRNHEAGVATAGLAGYGIGSTATAVAAMDAITRQRGPAPRATTIVPPTGGFLIDLTNAPVISAFLRLLA
ncbi:sodium/glutamate symporter [Pseudoduganella sp. UC29_71]|uniref:sodium/glutamate symporter n=1 Tax=Pseudoduganella sp. UC29_71 TaxID=3350174 RepID=UPI00366BFAD0